MQCLVNVIDYRSESGTVLEAVAIDEPVFTDGPFVEATEWAAGFWIIDAPDLDVALKLMCEGSKACDRRLEVRPLLSEP